MRPLPIRLLVMFGGTLAVSACATTASVARPQPFPVSPAPASHAAATPPAPSPFPLSSLTSSDTSPAPDGGASRPDATLLVSKSGVDLAPTPVAPVDVDVDTNAVAAGAVPARRVDAVLKTALSLQGTRYRLGGELPASGFDCSGFVHYVFEQQQIDLPRTVAEQYDEGRKVPFDQMQRGDLLFFTTTAKGPTHVGIALGPSSLGQFVHAPGSGGVVRIEHFDTSYWRTRLIGVRRVVK